MRFLKPNNGRDVLSQLPCVPPSYFITSAESPDLCLTIMIFSVHISSPLSHLCLSITFLPLAVSPYLPLQALFYVCLFSPLAIALCFLALVISPAPISLFYLFSLNPMAIFRLFFCVSYRCSSFPFPRQGFSSHFLPLSRITVSSTLPYLCLSPTLPTTAYISFPSPLSQFPIFITSFSCHLLL